MVSRGGDNDSDCRSEIYRPKSVLPIMIDASRSQGKIVLGIIISDGTVHWAIELSLWMWCQGTRV